MQVRVLGDGDLALFEAMNTMFGEVFEEPDTYTHARPSADYVGQLLDSDTFIAIVAIDDDSIVGGLTAYVLRKFERERSEIYIYDLAVVAGHRRQGIATALIEELRSIAAGFGAYVIFIQADNDNPPAINLYSKLGVREDVHHFDIDVPGPTQR